MRGEQRYRCKACGPNFTDTPARGMPLRGVKVTAVLLSLSGLSMDRRTAKLLAEGTHGIGRDHARQRHWLARFRRRTCVVSKAVRMVDASIALFIRFGDRAGIGEPLSMLA
jgi:transposase-like protein